MLTLYRSSNAPIIFNFDINIESTPNIEVCLYTDASYTQLIQKWTKDDLIVKEKYLIVPLTQEDTSSFPIGIGHLELKWLDENNFALFTKPHSILIKSLSNINILGDDEQIDYDNLDIDELLKAETLNKYHLLSVVTDNTTSNYGYNLISDDTNTEQENLETIQ